jgi:hypothetical protein
MTSIALYSQYAETSLVAYASALSSAPGASNTAKYKTAGMAEVEAARFDQEWLVLSQSPDDTNGFSAVLLQNVQSGEKVLAIRGTEGSQGGADYVADFIDVAVLGGIHGMPQYIALERFYQQILSTGKLGPTEQFTVTGHSLGGILAQGFTANHDSVVRTTFTPTTPLALVGSFSSCWSTWA